MTRAAVTMAAVTMAAVTGSGALAAAGIVVAAPSAYADAATTSTCAPLPAWVNGRPAPMHAGSATGDYLWHDKDGWHLRVTHPSKHQKVFAGTITASAPITFQRVKDEAHDKVALSPDRTKLTFRFTNYGHIDGVDFTDSCATSTRFAFTVDGHRATRNQVWIGAHSARPRTNPFVITRQSSQPTA